MASNFLKRCGIAAILATLALGASQAKAQDPYCAPGYVKVWCEPVYQAVCNKVWCEPVYQTVCNKAWCEPVYQTVCRQVWCEPVTCQRPCVTYDHCGRPITTYRTEIVTPGHYNQINQQVLVTPGHYNTVHNRVLVTPGRYDTVHNRVLVTPGHYTTRRA